MFRKLRAVLLEPANFFLNIVFQEIAVALPVSVGQLAQLALKQFLVKELGQAHTTAGSLGTIAWANSSLGGANSVRAQLDFFEAINSGVEVKVDVASVGYEDALAGIYNSLGLNIGKFLEERWYVEDDARTDQVDAFRRDKTGWEEMEVVGDATV